MSRPEEIDVSGKIVDVHTHVASFDYFPEPFIQGIVANMSAALRNRKQAVPDSTISRLLGTIFSDPLCDALVEEMDAAGIQCAVLVIPDFTYAMEGSRLTIYEMVDQHIEIASRHAGRFYLFPGFDPRWGAPAQRYFQRCAEEGLVHGLKVYPPCGYSPSDPLLYPFYDICGDHGLPVMSHVGASSPSLQFDTAKPMDIDRAAHDYPGVNFILAHGGCHHRDDCKMLCSHRPNVFLDVSGFPVANLDDISNLFGASINHKILFGTDWPLFRLRGCQTDHIAPFLCRGFYPEGTEDNDISAFLYGNTLSLLKGR